MIIVLLPFRSIDRSFAICLEWFFHKQKLYQRHVLAGIKTPKILTGRSNRWVLPIYARVASRPRPCDFVSTSAGKPSVCPPIIERCGAYAACATGARQKAAKNSACVAPAVRFRGKRMLDLSRTGARIFAEACQCQVARMARGSSIALGRRRLQWWPCGSGGNRS